MKLSIVIPCYNESENIENSFQTLKKITAKITPNYEIIFVDNGGTDNQLELMKKIYQKNKNHVKIISLSRNFGYQISMTAGIENAKGDAIILIDADLQDPAEMINDFVKKWKEGYDVVYGIRKKRQGTFINRILYKLFYKILAFTSDIFIPRDAGEFGLISKKIAEKINQMPENIRFIRGLRAWVGFKQCGIPYERGNRKKGKSNFNFFFKLYFSLRWYFIFFNQSFIVFLNCWSICFIFIYNTYNLRFTCKVCLFNFNTWLYASIIIVISFFSGFNIVTLGLMGAVLERILIEVKDRPKYLIRESFGLKK